MKKLLLGFSLLIASQAVFAHPGLDSHAHDSIIGEWGWVVPVFLVLFVIGRRLLKAQLKPASTP